MTTREIHKKYQQIDGINWGTDVIEEADWIDLSKEYKTVSGKRVILSQIVLYNSLDEEVTFPVKGSVVVSEKPFKTKFSIWTLDGRWDTIKKNCPLDLIKV